MNQRNSLVSEIRQILVRRVILCVISIFLIGGILHFGWSFQQRSALRVRILNAVSRICDEAITNSDLIAIKRNLQAIRLSNPEAKICLLMDGNLNVTDDICESESFPFQTTLTGRNFSVKVDLPWLTPMTLVGIPFVFASIFLLFFIVISLSEIAKKITMDLRALVGESKVNKNFYFTELMEANGKIETGIHAQIEYEKSKVDVVIGQRVAQIAHDIRSPLAVLEMMTPLLEGIDEDKRKIIRGATHRIRDIANSIQSGGMPSKKSGSLLRNRAVNATNGLEAVLIFPLIESIFSEKRIQFGEKKNIQLILDQSEATYGIFCEIEVNAFQRIVSNILNNAIESLVSESGKVKVTINAVGGEGAIIFSDTGCGISEENMKTIGNRGASFGKKQGSGLGLSHAMENISNWNGRLEISSTVNLGTSITIFLPLSPVPDWFVSSLNFDDKTKIHIVDDDSSIHLLWNQRFHDRRIKLPDMFFNFTSPEIFEAYIKSQTAGLDNALFLIDYEYVGSSRNGIQIISSNGIADRSILVTSRYDDQSIRAECIKNNIKVIPKSMSGFIPIEDRNI
jgi:signal transduction histidine kinase